MTTAKRLPVDSITLDAELQPRDVIDSALVAEYAGALNEGATFPPISVFRTPEGELLLADGYHRLSAHTEAGRDHIDADVRKGGRVDALRYSLCANATHGSRRSPGDIKRSYAIAVANEIVAAGDSRAVAATLQCSRRWAERLTQPAREEAREARDTAILAAKAKGESNRAIARRLDIDEGTVRGAEKTNNAQIPQQLSVTTRTYEGPMPRMMTEPPKSMKPFQIPRFETRKVADLINMLNYFANAPDPSALPHQNLKEFAGHIRDAKAWLTNALVLVDED